VNVITNCAVIAVLGEESTTESTGHNSSTVIALPAAPVPGMRFAPIVRFKQMRLK
jgi:hypothetical protein